MDKQMMERLAATTIWLCVLGYVGMMVWEVSQLPTY